MPQLPIGLRAGQPGVPPVLHDTTTTIPTHVAGGTTYSVAAGQSQTVSYSVTHGADAGFFLDGGGAASSITQFINQGTVTVDIRTGLEDDTTGHTSNSIFWNKVGADFEVSPPSDDPVGVTAAELNFTNDGTFNVVGVNGAMGMFEGFGAETASFTNTGTFTVTANGSAAHGYLGNYAGTFNNSGTITATGHATDNSSIGTETYAVSIFHQNTAPSAINSGTITATDVGGTSLGIVYSLDTSQQWTFTNSGTITADVAIEEYQNKSNQGPNSTLIDNSGTINGKMLLDFVQPSSNAGVFGEAGPIVHTVDNDLHGVINGDVVFGKYNDVFSGAAGTMNGTIYGGGGNDTITGGLGATKVGYTGNAGDHSISFDAATSTFTVSDLRNNAPDGSDTVKGIYQFVFADGTYTYDSQGRLTEHAVIDGGGTTVSHYDFDGSEPWSQQREHYTPAGDLDGQVDFNDNGTTWTTTYTPGSAPTPWSSAETDQNGQFISIVNGIGGALRGLTLFDDTNSAAWTSISIHFASDGSWSSVSELNDDNSTTVDMSAVDTAYDNAQWYATPYDMNLHNAPSVTPIIGGPDSEVLYGYAGNDTINGGGGDDFIAGGTGDDLLTGGAGADRFAFATGDGSDTVTDFTPGTDTIQLNGFDTATFAALQPFMSQQGSDTLIAFDPQDHILLKGVQMVQLQASDFVFH